MGTVEEQTPSIRHHVEGHSFLIGPLHQLASNWDAGYTHRDSLVVVIGVVLRDVVGRAEPAASRQRLVQLPHRPRHHAAGVRLPLARRERACRPRQSLRSLQGHRRDLYRDGKDPQRGGTPLHPQDSHRVLSLPGLPSTLPVLSVAKQQTITRDNNIQEPNQSYIHSLFHDPIQL